MKKIKIKDLEAGMRFTEPVFLDRDTILVQADIPLKQKEIDRLAKWNIDEVQTNGMLIADTGQKVEVGDSGVSVTSDMAAPYANSKELKLYNSAVKRMTDILGAVAKKQKVDHDMVDSVVKDLITAVEEDEKAIIQLILLESDAVNRLPENSVKSSILATVIGKNMKMLSFRLIQLTTGALLHDVGMIKIPEEIRTKKGKLAPEEIKQVRSHPIHGYTIVLKELKYPEEVAAIALLHQERWDGTGYPRRLKGDDIPIGARIVAVADAFVAMVNKRAYRDQLIGYRAMKAILSDNGRHFDPKVLKALLMSMGIYPVGSVVQLNNGSIGRVIETHSVAPLRPKILLIVDEYGDRLVGEITVDLLEQKDLFIAKAIDPRKLERMAGE